MAGRPSEADKKRARQKGRGRKARSPAEIPALGWKDVAWRIWASIQQDRILLVAAGATFYLLLALFPALAAFVSLYGFVADPRTVAEHVAFLGGLMPSGSVAMIEAQLDALATQATGTLSFGFLTGFAVALWSANNGIKAMFEGMNVAYGENEKRSFLRLNLVSFAFTLGAMLVGIAMIITVGVVPAVLAFLRLDGFTETIIRLTRWPIILVAIGLAIALLFRFGPSREPARLRWLSWGVVVSTVIWLSGSIAFSYYLENFADYDATYGTLGAVIGFMMWTWVSVIILLFGAELNAALEHQTAVDTTTGRTKPMGSRGARVADTVGAAAD